MKRPTKTTVVPLTLRVLQDNQPWIIPYEWEQRALVGYEERDLCARHVLLHAQKTVGKLATVFESIDHNTGRTTSDENEKEIRAMAADLVTEAIRLANLYSFDLERVLCERTEEKNGGHGFDVPRRVYRQGPDGGAR